MTRRLILTADDFGMSVEVNEAVELAHREGILTCASLVVAGAAADDAVRRAKRMPTLGVGLHLAMFGAPAQLRSPSLLARDGENLGTNPVSTGIAVMLSPRARTAARREFAAQFEAYRKSGLPLGHLDGHWHCHQHPAVLAMALEMGKPMGLAGVRVPHEPYALNRRVTGGGGLAASLGAWPLAAGMRRQIRKAGLVANDVFFGQKDMGFVTSSLLKALAPALPEGLTEVGFHPATAHWAGPHAPPPHWDPTGELAALTDPAVREAFAANGVALCRWSDLA